MVFWILIATFGFILSFFGLRSVLNKYRRSEVSRRYFIAIIVGFISFVSYAVISSLHSEITGGIPDIILLLPAFIAIVIVVQEHQYRNKI